MLRLWRAKKCKGGVPYTVPTFAREPEIARFGNLQRVVDAAFLGEQSRSYEVDTILTSLARLDQPTRILIILRYGLSSIPARDVTQLARMGATDLRSVLHFLNLGLEQIARDLRGKEHLTPLAIGEYFRRR